MKTHREEKFSEIFIIIIIIISDIIWLLVFLCFKKKTRFGAQKVVWFPWKQQQQ